MRGVIISFLAIIVMAFAPASAREIKDSVSAAEIEAMMKEAGLGGTILKDRKTGAPVATGKIGRSNYVIRALECSGQPVRCEQLLFFANFSLGRPIKDSDYKLVNQFNDSSPDGRAYIISGKNQLGIDYYIDLTGGVTTEHIGARMRRWTGVVDNFIRQINKGLSGS